MTTKQEAVQQFFFFIYAIIFLGDKMGLFSKIKNMFQKNEDVVKEEKLEIEKDIIYALRDARCGVV